ncbi:TetR family transcriptional regulator C-terminal domain-containing protein [Bradyrhizobium sp. B120]|uniref:TetR/AcrR family transcriptional regulator n=1 Tax=Bradyrhizobium sp. B120 TaxID=3410088 RepID=UPI003B985550
MAKQDIREKLSAVGLETLHRNGFNGSSVQDIVDAAGVPKGSFYHHFDSKEALGLDAIDRYWGGFGPRLSILTDASHPPIDRLRRYFESLAETLKGWKYQKGCFIGNASAEMADQSPAMRVRLSTVFAGWTRAVELCVQEAQTRGDMSSDLDAAMIASYLLNSWEGAALRAKVEKDSKALDQFLAVMTTKILI